MRTTMLSILGVALVAACSGTDAPPNGPTNGAAGKNASSGAGGSLAESSGGMAGSLGPSGAAGTNTNGAGASTSGGSGGVGSMGGSSGVGTGGGAAGGGIGQGTAGGGGSSSGAAGAGSGTMIFDGSSLNGWTEYPPGNWKVVDGTLKATGKGRGFIATNTEYTHYRLLFSLKPGGTGGHAPCVLQFCTQPPPTLDACGGIQFQPPNGGTWDYRPGHNDNGGTKFSHIGKPGPPDADGFYHCEVVANAMTGEAKLACGGKDVVHFKDPTAGKKGPWAIQTHNAGFSDEYKDLIIEEGITSDDYITVK